MTEFRVNTTTANGHYSPAVAMDAGSDFVVTWYSLGQDQSGDNFGGGIYAQRYNAAGVAQGGEFLVNTTTFFGQFFPAVAMDADGDFVVTWSSQLQDGSGNGIYAQRYNAAGVAQGGEFRVNTTTANNQNSPAVAMDADGDFVVTWESVNQDGSFGGIYAQRYNAAGVAQGGEFRVNTRTVNDQRFPAVAMDADGDFVVTWTSNQQDGSGYGIYAQRYNAAGVAQGGEFRVNTTTANSQVSPAVAMDADGDFVVTWYSLGQDQSGDNFGGGIYAQRYNAAGVAQGGEFLVNTTTFFGQFFPAVAMDADGDFVVTWTSDQQDGSGYGIYAQRYNAAGVAQGGEFRVNTTTANSQQEPAVAMDADGDFVLTWTSIGQDGMSGGIYAQRYNAAGVPQGGDVAANTSTTSTLAAGETRSGQIDQNDISGNYIDADYFRVTLTGGQQYRFSASAGVDTSDSLTDVFIRLRDASGRTLSPDIHDEGAAPEFVFNAPGVGPQTFYLAISAGGSGAWWDDTGTYSVSLAQVGAAPPTNYRPTAVATNRTGNSNDDIINPGDIIPLSQLFSYSDPDGIADIVSFAVQDRTPGGGYLTYLNQRMDPNVVYERPIGQIGDWAFVVGPPGTDYVGFNAVDTAGTFNPTVVASVSGSQMQGSADALFGQKKLSTLADFAFAAYQKNEEEAAALAQKGWILLNDENLAANRWIKTDGTNLKDTLGQYIDGNYFENQNSSALVAKSADGKTLIISFTGTNSIWDRFDWITMGQHYYRFLPLFQEMGLPADIRVLESSHGFENIIVTGHSLGAAMAQAFKQHMVGENVAGVVFANPGLVVDSFQPFPDVPAYPAVPRHLNNFTSITIAQDPITLASILTDLQGDQIRLEVTRLPGEEGDSPLLPSLHDMNLYRDVAQFLESRSADVFQLQQNDTGDNPIHYFKPYGRVFVGDTDPSFSVLGSPSGVFVTPDTIIVTGQPTAPRVTDEWTFSTNSDDRSRLTINASTYSSTNWTVSADNGQVLLSNSNQQELLRSTGFGSLQLNSSSLADINLIIKELEGTTILNETVYVSAGHGNDKVDGSATDRRIVATGGEGNDTMFGGVSGDYFSGNNGSDMLDGGTGADTMDGGTGDDIFFVMDTGDVVLELAHGGADTIITQINLAVPDHVEALRIAEGVSGIIITGGAGNDVLIGNGLANNFDGGAGDDVILAGNVTLADIYALFAT
jgi:hypothetical protein